MDYFLSPRYYRGLEGEKLSKNVWTFSLIADGWHSNITVTLPILLSHVMAQAVSC